MRSPADALYSWADPLDPSEHKDFAFSFAAETTATGSTIASASWALSSAAIAAGVEIDTSSVASPVCTVWLQVDGANQSDAGFNAPDGTDFAVEVTATDSAGRIYQRTIRLTVVQL
jgi:hypothetical protein